LLVARATRDVLRKAAMRVKRLLTTPSEGTGAVHRPSGVGMPFSPRPFLVALVMVIGLPASLAVSNDAAGGKPFIIADQDGYGTSECLASASSCGRIIAESFCQSKGFRAHVSYRVAEADDVTGSLGSATRAPRREPTAFVIFCR
jgi:hypothetical protein